MTSRPKRSVLPYVIGIPLAVLAVAVLIVAAFQRTHGLVPTRTPPPEGEVVAEAENALRVIPSEANRSARRPLGLDAVLRPVDDLIIHANNAFYASEFDRAVRVAGEAARLAEAGLQLSLRSNRGPRTQRFPEQVAEAMKISAGARLASARTAGHINPDDADRPTPPMILEAIRSDVERGLRQRPSDTALLFQSATVSSLGGRWPAAAEALETAVNVRPDFADAWNELGRVRIHLRDLDGAEQAFVRASESARPLGGEAPEAAYQTAMFNRAMFHINLARHFQDEARRTGALGDRLSETAAQTSLNHHLRNARTIMAELRHFATAEEIERLNRDLGELGQIGP